MRARLSRALAALVLALVGIAGVAPASAAPTINYTPSNGPIAAAPAPGFAQLVAAGLTDPSGNVYSVAYSTSRGNLLVTPTSANYPVPVVDANTADWSTNLTQQVIFSSGASGGSNLRLYLRATNSGGYGSTAYSIIFANTYASVSTLVSGATTQIGTSQSFNSLAPTAIYTAYATCSQTNSTMTSITITLADATGASLANYTVSDTTAALQNVVGTSGVTMNLPSTTKLNDGVQNIQFFPTASATPVAAAAGTTAAATSVNRYGAPLIRRS